jgi:hypothetical protein
MTPDRIPGILSFVFPDCLQPLRPPHQLFKHGIRRFMGGFVCHEFVLVVYVLFEKGEMNGFL